MSTEETFGVTLKIAHDSGVISGARILKGRSKLPEDLLTTINCVLAGAFAPPKEPTKTTVALGNLGEQMVMAHLTNISRCNGDFSVSDTSNMKDHGDIAVEYRGKRICIEVKNYTKPIPGKEIDKYHHSLSLPDYDIGVMISMGDHGFAREYKIKSPIDVRLVDGKPTAYLSGVDLDLLYPTISLLMSMVSTDTTSEDLEHLLSIKTKALLAIHEQANAMRVLIESQKKGLGKLEDMLNDIRATSLN